MIEKQWDDWPRLRARSGAYPGRFPDFFTASLGMGAQRRDGEIHFHHPTIIIVGVKPD
jgi:hypothetical protein